MKTLAQPKLVFLDIIFPRTLAKDIILVLGFSILTVLCAKATIEIGPVPITMQTFSVLLAGALLGSKKGALSQITYLLGGLAGLPWFSRGGGFQYILSPTFGYIIGFVFCAFLVGWLTERGFNKNLKGAILTMFLGNIVIYLFGLPYLATFVGFNNVLTAGLYPFLSGDLLKIFLAGAILPFALKVVKNKI